MSGSSEEVVMRVSNVGVCYKQRVSFLKKADYWAVKDVSFNVFRGETIGVIGRNGVGKSTLLKVLTGIIMPDKGSVKSYGHTVALLGLLVGFKQKLSGRENAVMNAMLQGVDKSEIERKLDEIEKFAELEGFFDQPVSTYSAGMRTRLRFAVAMQVNPDIMLVDEVLGVGDASFSKKSGKVIKDRIRSKKTVIVVSHHLETIKELCTRVIWLEGGETKMVGPVDAVIENYKKALPN